MLNILNMLNKKTILNLDIMGISNKIIIKIYEIKE
jgi:hypothetical protein